MGHLQHRHRSAERDPRRRERRHLCKYSDQRERWHIERGTARIATAVTTPPPPAAPPTISGSPATSVVAGQSYSFTPTTTDPSGRTLTFSISNKPSWAAFN